MRRERLTRRPAAGGPLCAPPAAAPGPPPTERETQAALERLRALGVDVDFLREQCFPRGPAQTSLDDDGWPEGRE